jgi:hypothetical protein
MAQMAADLVKALSDVLETKQQKGWLALFVPERFPLQGYRSRRIGKLMPDGVLQFSIGATALGVSRGLNETIQEIIRSERLTVLDCESTSGSRVSEGYYPAFQTEGLPVAQVLRIVHLVLGAALQGQR